MESTTTQSRLGRAASRLYPPSPGCVCVCVCVVFWGGEQLVSPPPPPPARAALPLQASICPRHRKVICSAGWGPPSPPPQEWGFGAGGGSPGPGAGGEGDKQARGLIAVIITIIMAFIWLPNESDHRQREKLSIAQALMNFFANCNQARPSQLAD